MKIKGFTIAICSENLSKVLKQMITCYFLKKSVASVKPKHSKKIDANYQYFVKEEFDFFNLFILLGVFSIKKYC